MRISRNAQIAVAVVGLASLFGSVSAMADMSDMTAAHDYFVAHSFDFPKNFRFTHPGPEWVLQHADDFHLTSQQSSELKAMSKEMFDDMKNINVETQDAYAKYAKDAAMREPSGTELKGDIHGIGKAEEALAYTMIPFHLRTYAMLTPDQKKTFNELVEKGAAKK